MAAWIWDISWTAGTTEMWRALMEAMWEESPEAPPPPSEDPRVNVWPLAKTLWAALPGMATI